MIALTRVTYCGSARLCGQISTDPRHDLLKAAKEALPAKLGALIGLLLILPEARLLHAQEGSRACRGKGPGDDAFETKGVPRVRQYLVQLDCTNLTVDGTPVSAEIEPMADGRFEVVLHQPLLDQVRLRERTPDLLRWIRDLPFDNDRECFGGRIGHWSILLSKSSRWSN